MITGLCAPMRRLAVVAGLPLVLLLSTAVPAFANSESTGADVVVAQTLGDRELTVVLRRVTSVPGPLSVDIITHTGTAPGRLALTVTPTGTTSAAPGSSAPGTPTAEATVELGAHAGSYSATVPVDRPRPRGFASGVLGGRCCRPVARWRRCRSPSPPRCCRHRGRCHHNQEARSTQAWTTSP